MTSRIPPGTFTLVDEIPLCSLCDRWHGERKQATYDAMLPSLGFWAFVCVDHFHALRCALGVGRGQQLVLRSYLRSDEPR